VRAAFTPIALAEKLGVSPATVRRWCAEGRFPGAWRTPAEALPDFEPPAPRGGDRRSDDYQRQSLCATA
jgi:hypothetical protein